MLNIVKYPDPILKHRCAPVDVVGGEERKLLENLVKAMRLNQGVGLAAPQVGINRQMAVVDTQDTPLLKLINPDVLEMDGADVVDEGCLSVPGVYIPVKRPTRVKIKSLDENGREIIIEASGFRARAILHEIDHLKGRLIIDHLNPIKRFLLLRRQRG